jgi:hypothetical protein
MNNKKLLYQEFTSPQLEWPYSRAKTTTTAGKDMAKQEPIYTVGRNTC